VSGVKRGERAGNTHTHTHDDGIDLAGTDSLLPPTAGSAEAGMDLYNC